MKIASERPPLPGLGYRILHNKLQHILISMMKVAGIGAVPEAANFLFDKLPEPFLSRYINHRVQHANQRNSPHSIIPDIHAYNFPSHRQNVNYSGASQTDEALFEVKTIQACPARYNHENVIKRAVDERVRDDHMRSTKRVIELSNGLMWNLHQRL
jgi:hypothetical protein